jgi:hypothetical protein
VRLRTSETDRVATQSVKTVRDSGHSLSVELEQCLRRTTVVAMARALTLSTVIWLISACVACGDDGGVSQAAPSGGKAGAAGVAGHSGESAAASGGATAPSGQVYGNLNVSFVPHDEETMAAARTSILGSFKDGPTPSVEVWSVDREAGGCTLYVPNHVTCLPSCGSSAACTADDTCTPYPKATTVGTVTLSGIGEQAIAMEPIADNYQPKTSVPYPPCNEGDAIGLSAAGGSHAAFEIAAKCIAPLQFDGTFTLRKGQPLQLEWSPPAQASLAKIDVKLDISHHGGSTGKVECEVADTGSLEIAATLVDALLDLGYAGFPTVSVTRKFVAAAGGNASNASLTIAAPVERPLQIPGLESCSENSDCSTGKTCQVDRTCK